MKAFIADEHGFIVLCQLELIDVFDPWLINQEGLVLVGLFLLNDFDLGHF